jgi:hypothetical protein
MGRREVSFPLAGFLASSIGRFWVSPEGYFARIAAAISARAASRC